MKNRLATRYTIFNEYIDGEPLQKSVVQQVTWHPFFPETAQIDVNNLQVICPVQPFLMTSFPSIFVFIVKQ